MTVESNVFYAKRNVVDSIWKEANIEGIAVTFPQTKEIFEGRTVAGLSVDETVAINNLKHAWQFVFDNLDAPMDLAFVRQVNGIVGAGIVACPGELRMSDVGIGGTGWRTDIPDYDTAKAMVEAAAAIGDPQESAMRLFCELCRSQLFYDGNKRTAQICANKVLIAGGAGVFAIPVQSKTEFESLLVGFYETADSTALEGFLVQTALDGYDEPAAQKDFEARLGQTLRDARGQGRGPALSRR